MKPKTGFDITAAIASLEQKSYTQQENLKLKWGQILNNLKPSALVQEGILAITSRFPDTLQNDQKHLPFLRRPKTQPRNAALFSGTIKPVMLITAELLMSVILTNNAKKIKPRIAKLIKRVFS